MTQPLEEAIEISQPAAGEDAAAIEGRSLREIVWSRLLRDKWAITALVTIAIIFVLAIFAPIVTRLVGVDPYAFDSTSLSQQGGLPNGWLNSGISRDHPLGVEPLTGRDILARLLYGSRISLLVAVAATAITVVIGTVVGTIAGYLGGGVDTAIGRLMDLLLAFPQLLLVLALSPVLVQRLESFGVPGGNTSRVTYLILVFSFFGWPYLARLVRGQVISLREREFIESAVSMGSSSTRIVFRELIPNLYAPILVFATIALPNYIGLEAALSFLGVGVVEPQATWGKMLADSVRYFNVVPTYLFVPGTALLLVVLSFNVLGDAVRDALDPRSGRV